jgi:hypothetical protein
VCKHRRLRLVSAAILGERNTMAREQSHRLQEAPGGMAPDARVIDAQFTEVGPKKRGLLGRVWAGVLTVFWVAVIGFLIPPMLVVVNEISGYFAGR